MLVLHNKAQSSRLEIFLHICSFQADHLHELAALLLPSVVGFSAYLSFFGGFQMLSDAFSLEVVTPLRGSRIRACQRIVRLRGGWSTGPRVRGRMVGPMFIRRRESGRF